MTRAETIARAFHETYERLAPAHGWETQAESRTAWDDVPQANRDLMVHTVEEMLKRGEIRAGVKISGTMHLTVGGSS